MTANLVVQGATEPKLVAVAVDAEAVWDLCEVVRARPAVRRLVTLSSRSVYGAYRPEEGPVGEEAAPRPVGFYGAAKAAADLAVSRYKHALGVDVVAARITGPYGPGQRYPTHAGELLDAVAGGRPVRRPAGADDRYETVYVKDTVAGVLSLLDAPALSHAVYNVGTGRLVTLGEVAAALRRLVPDAVVELGPGCADPVPRAAMCVERIRAETGFTSAWTLETGLGDALAAMAEGPAPEPGSVFAGGRWAATRWVWIDPMVGQHRGPVPVGELDATELRRDALAEW